MLDRPEFPPDYPAGRLHFKPSERILCFAPHPDDEIIGCGGLLALAASQDANIYTVILSAGECGLNDAEGDENPRLNESVAAAEILGLPHPQCWQWGDRQLRYGLPLIDRLTQEIINTQPDWILLPAITEPHPDHQVLALAGMAALMQCEVSCSVLFYEVGAPIVPNTLLDISEVSQAKWNALDAFVSQEKNHPYRRHAQAMGTLRALGMGPGVIAAEAYWQVTAQVLRQKGPVDGISFWPLQRHAMQLASLPQQLPLVSVLIRSMDRACLAQAVTSVVAQTYPNIEVVIVNATGRIHGPVSYPVQRLSLRMVGAEHNDSISAFVPLSRSAAANTALHNALGSYAIFLDDDDLLMANHVEKLVGTLQQNARAVAAYTGVKVEDLEGKTIREYDTAWSEKRLLGINFLPIHAVLFRMQTWRDNDSVCFDETLPVLEDWDFWCQISRQGDFVHVPGVSAIYRQGEGTSHVSDPTHANYWAAWHLRILAKHTNELGVDSHIASLAWHAIALDQIELQYDGLKKELPKIKNLLEREQALHTESLIQNGKIISEYQEKIEKLKLEIISEEKRYFLLETRVDSLQFSIDALQKSRAVRWAKWLRRLLSLGLRKGDA